MKPQVPDGMHVNYRHVRWLGTADFSIRPHGGCTEATVYNEYGKEIARAVAICHPRDNFCKRIGRDIALGRALKKLSE